MRWLKSQHRLHPHPRHQHPLDSDEKFRCFGGCCHVQTGTVCLGIWNITTQLLGLCVLVFALLHPELVYEREMAEVTGVRVNEGKKAVSPVFDFKVDTPILGAGSPEETVPELPTPLPQHPLPVQSESAPSGVSGKQLFDRDEFGRFAKRHLESGDVHLAVALLLGLISITLLMVYGAMKSRPIYLLPFFCFQVFDFILACMTAVGHYTWLPTVQNALEDSPFDSQWVALFLLVGYILVLIVKAYCIGVVWACYQYLHLRNNGVLAYTSHRDEETLLPPDYETATKMPMYEVPPPSYAAPPPPAYIG